jgi:hypothetical protein
MINLVVTRGDTREFTLRLRDNGAAANLTGAKIWFTVGTLLTKTVGDGIVVDDPTSGVAVVTLVAGETAAAPNRLTVHPYDVQVLMADGRLRTPIRGHFTIRSEVQEATA